MKGNCLVGSGSLAILGVSLLACTPISGQTTDLQATGFLDRLSLPTVCLQGRYWVADPCTGQSMIAEPLTINLDDYLCQYVGVSGPDVGVECPIIRVQELRFVRPPCGMEVRGLGIHAGTMASWLTWEPFPCAESYDVIRGSLPGPAEGSGLIDLGAVQCLAENLPGTIYSLSLDPSEAPPAGEVFFYLIRVNLSTRSVPSVLTPYGFSRSGLERVPSSGDCLQ